MAYVPTTFVDRSVEFPNRRKLTAVPGQADTFDVARAEGTVFAEGTKPDAANLNAEFGKIKTETDAINTSLTAPTVGMFIYDYQNGSHGFNTSPTRGADTFHPFKNLMDIQPFLMRSSSTPSTGTAAVNNSVYNVEGYASVVLTVLGSLIHLIVYGSNDLSYDNQGGLVTKTEITRVSVGGDITINVSAYKYLQLYLMSTTTALKPAAFEIKSWTV